MSPPNITSSGIVDRRPATARAPSADEAALETALAAHGIPTPQIRKLVRLAAPQPAENRVVALTRAVAQLYLFNPLGADAGRFIFVGAPGVGKTLAIAKLAARAKAHGRTVRLITSDAARSGGIEQLRHFATTLGLEIEIAADAAALAALAASHDAAVLIDSAGINPYSPNDRAALEALATAAQAEPILVLAAGGDPADTVETAHVFRDIGCQRFLVTRLDIVQRLGSVMAVPEALGIAFAEGLSATSLGRGVETFTAETLAARLLRHRRKSAERCPLPKSFPGKAVSNGSAWTSAITIQPAKFGGRTQIRPSEPCVGRTAETLPRTIAATSSSARCSNGRARSPSTSLSTAKYLAARKRPIALR